MVRMWVGGSGESGVSGSQFDHTLLLRYGSNALVGLIENDELVASIVPGMHGDDMVQYIVVRQ